MRISDWSSDVCSSDLGRDIALALRHRAADRDAVGGLARAAEIQPRLFAIFAAARHIEILAHHQLTVRHDNGALDAVFKFADISRPARLVDRLQGVGRDAAHPGVNPARILVEDLTYGPQGAPRPPGWP